MTLIQKMTGTLSTLELHLPVTLDSLNVAISQQPVKHQADGVN